ncbi:MAG: TRAP transporter small permease [Arenicella sp.]
MFKSVLGWINDNIEKVIILISYSAMASIIFVEVIRRFFFNVQAPWSTTIPIYLFLWLTWMGTSYNTKHRSHLRFTEVRERLSYSWQFACLMLDAALWYIFGAIVIYFSIEQVSVSYDNFSIVQGTDDVMQWWFYLATPLAWSLLLFRVTQNLVVDVKSFRAGEPLITQAAMFSD